MESYAGVKIEANVPTPMSLADLFRRMKSGDSFLAKEGADRGSLFSSAYHTGVKIRTRKDKLTGRIRVWKV